MMSRYTAFKSLTKVKNILSQSDISDAEKIEKISKIGEITNTSACTYPNPDDCPNQCNGYCLNAKNPCSYRKTATPKSKIKTH